MNLNLLLDEFSGWCYQFSLTRELERRWYRSRLWRLVGVSWNRRNVRFGPSHLYETIIGNDRFWFKLQATCWSSRQAAVYMEARFNGARYTTADGHRPVTPFRLSECSNEITNWESIVKQLPDTWDEDEYTIERYPYPWCETLSEGCNCRASGRNIVVCSEYGIQQETGKKKERSRNAWHDFIIKEMETRIEKNDKAQRIKRTHSTSGPETTGNKGAFVYPSVPAGQGTDRSHTGVPTAALDRLNQLASAGFYCSIHRIHHPFGKQPIRRTMASLNAACEAMSALDEDSRRSARSHMVNVAEHYLRRFQSEECAHRSAWGNVDMPKILYKYVSREHIGSGVPDSLRATQLLALNDNMECSLITMKDVDQPKLEMLLKVKENLKEHLDIDIPWHELLQDSLLHGSPRLSLSIQKYLNPLVGVVSFTTDICVPTMWAHYARNTGIVVGYDTEALRKLGFELQPVLYSEIAPIYRPLSGDDIELSIVDREEIESDERMGRQRDGLPILATTKLAKLGSDWKSLSRLLFVKGISWEYEKEVRLLVDLKLARDTGKCDSDGWPIKVINLPPEAIREIYGGVNTRKSDVDRAVQVARNGNKDGLFVGHLSSHAFRIEKTGGTRF